MKQALVVGIGDYSDLPTLPGAITDATKIAQLLQGSDGDVAGEVVWHLDEESLLVDGVESPAGHRVTVRQLNRAIGTFFDESRFDPDSRVDLLFYFSGHAVQHTRTLVKLQAFDGDSYSFGDLMELVEGLRSPNRTVTIILDCCMSGALGANPFVPRQALLLENVSILSATRSGELAKEDPRRGGLFSQQLRGGLEGAAADLLGNITPMGLYAYASSAMGDVDQTPTFKSHVVEPPLIRKVEPRVPLASLRQLHTIFRKASSRVTLTPSHEGLAQSRLDDPHDTAYLTAPDDEDYGANNRHDEKRQPFTGSRKQIENDHLKAYRNANLLKTQDDRDFWFLAMEPNPAKSNVWLTELGRYYWRLAKAGLLPEE
ncbi:MULTISPECIES: caspase family protein [Aeromicrobium]|uniref:caspase family protein n=1 Tax=Aeromicrobium TaxID=2040 RepID=UPI00257F6775|nr:MULTISPECIES: caspase family protein [Aeromicrobium]